MRLHNETEQFLAYKVTGPVPPSEQETGQEYWKSMNRKTLAKSKFILAPNGDGLGSSFRILEALSVLAPIYTDLY